MPAITSADGTQISYSAAGVGPTLIYIAGALMHRAIDGCAAGMAAALSSKFTVVTYDRRGRGDSTDTPPYAVQREVEDITALIAHVGGPATAFGESSGAVLALEAVRRGCPVTRLALYEPPFIVTPDRAPMPADYQDRIDALIADDRRDEALELFMTTAVELPSEVVAEVSASPMWPALRAVAPTLAYDARVMGDTASGDPAALERFASVDVPVLVLAGGESPAYQQNAVPALCSVLPDAQLSVVPGQRHQFDPTVIAPLVATFVADGASMSSQSAMISTRHAGESPT
jgi:pimeloyl-ACP methyl ester carboxylesterase